MVSVYLEGLASVLISVLLQEEQAVEVAALKNQMRSKEEDWRADKARMDSIAREADKKHQQLADRTALVMLTTFTVSIAVLIHPGHAQKLKLSGFSNAGAGQAAVLCKTGGGQCASSGHSSTFSCSDR